MVTIPTSRDVAFNSTRSGRIAPSGPTPMVGAALAGVGQSLVRAGFNLQELREKEQADLMGNRANEVSTALTRFVADEEQRFLQAREEASESGIGFTRQFMEGHQARANDFAKQYFNGMDPDQQTSYLNQIISRGNSLFEKANSYETVAKTNYYDRTTNTNLDTYRLQIRNNAADFAELKSQGLAAIDAANMPEAWKAERRQQWEADAAESKWQWKFRQNPQEALQELRPSGTKNLIRDEEGFRSEPYWDVNAWRIGYGSDTVTTADGRHIPVKPGMKITREDAERDLQYRLAEREGAQARKQIGSQWGTLTPNVQSALESVAYNYGSLPNSVVQAVKSGDNEKIAQAIEALPANRKRRSREAAVVRGTEQIQLEDAYEGIPYERREQLAAWGETQYSQQVTRDRAAAKDGYSLLIATQPEQVKESVILADTTLDNGDKAQLITSLRSAMKDAGAVNAMIGAMAAGNISVNPFDADQTKVANGAYDKLIGAAQTEEERNVITSDFVARTGYVPKRVQSDLRNGAMSSDPATFSQAMEAGLVLDKNAQASFRNFEGSEAVRNKMDLYRALTRDMGYSADEAAKKLIKANDPAYQARRESLLKSDTVKEELKKIDAASIAASFDDSFWGLGRNPKLGPTPAAEAAMVAEYRAIYQEAIVDADGDTVAAKAAADARFQRSYGVSELSSMGGNVVVKNPPEKVYPAGADGTHAYIREQLLTDLKAEGIDATNVYLNPDLDTDKDIRAGRPPAYRVMYEKDGKIEMYPMPYAPDPEAEKVKASERKVEVLRDAEQRMIDNRNRAVQEGQAVDRALSQTTGPDWMKARAAETATDQIQQQRTRDELKATRGNPGPIGGMGTSRQINDMINAGISN